MARVPLRVVPMRRDEDEVYDNWRDNSWEDREVNEKDWEQQRQLSEGDWKVLTMERASNRVLQEVMRALLLTNASVKVCRPYDVRTMLIKSDWTSAEMLVYIPRRMLPHQSNVHSSNLDFFNIKGVRLSEPQTVQLN